MTSGPVERWADAACKCVVIDSEPGCFDGIPLDVALDFARAHDAEDAARDAVTEKLREARNAWFLQACGLQLRVGAQKKALKACAEFEDEIAKETSNLREALRTAREGLERHGRHDVRCYRSQYGTAHTLAAECDCGLYTAIAAIDEVLK